MTNTKRVLAMADAMAKEVRGVQNIAWRIPDWAGLAWMLDPGYSGTLSKNIATAFGPEWFSRAKRICRALEIAYQGRREMKEIRRIESALAK